MYGYACFYKADTRRVNEVKADEVTITFVCLGYPREMCNYLEQTLHRSITVAGEGIYYISDPVFSIQLLVQKRLSEEENFWLKNLTNDLKEKQRAERLLVEYKEHQSDVLYQSVMNIIIDANEERFQVDDMCEALERIVEYHRQRDREEGGRLQLVDLIQKKLVKGKSLELIADELEETVEFIRPLYEQALQEMSETSLL